MLTVTIVVGLELAYFYFFDRNRLANFSGGAALFRVIATSLAAAGFCFIIGTVFRRSMDALFNEIGSDELVGARHPMALNFIEMRRFRVGVVRKMRQLVRENNDLKKTAFVDGRSGLANHVALEREVDKGVKKTSYEHPGAFLLLEIEKYHHITEQFGAVVSAALVKAAADRMKAELAVIHGPAGVALRSAELFAVQNERFALWMPRAIDRKQVVQIVRALRMAFTAPFMVEGHRITAGITGGIAMAPEEGDTKAKLMRHAELAIQQVRSEGTPSGFMFFTPRLTRVARGRYQLEAELREAIANREFKPVFQPKIDFATGRVVSAEALARWRRGNGKIISPTAFIPLAEETGLVNQIGEQIMESACESARSWLAEGHNVSVAVNVSPRQFQRGDLSQLVLNTLKSTGLPPSFLELEITESMAVSEPAHVAEVMAPLRKMGIKLAIDDFGTGHSNLSMLTQLPFDVFKIDRQFVSALDQDHQAPAIVEMILAMAETLGLKTVAEGVETPRQAEFLRRRGCTMAQGYLYSPGLPHSSFMDFLRNWQANPVPQQKQATG